MGKSIKFKICQRSVRHDAILKSCEIIFDQLGDCRQKNKTSPYLIVFTHHNTLCFHYKCSVISVLFAVLLTYNLAKMRCFFGPFLSFCYFFPFLFCYLTLAVKKTKHPPPLLKKKNPTNPLCISALIHQYFIFWSAAVFSMMNMQICSCSAILAMTNCLSSSNSPELFQQISLKYGHRSSWILNLRDCLQREVSCNLCHVAVWKTQRARAQRPISELQASVHALQSEACRQQDWHDVSSAPAPEPRCHELPRCTLGSQLFSPTQLINVRLRPNASASLLPWLFILRRPQCFE